MVLSFLSDSVEVALVSKSWNQIMKPFRPSVTRPVTQPTTTTSSSAVPSLFHGPPPLVICGPAGVGKGTLINLLITKYPSLFGFSVSHTTRAPRPGEVDGVHYHFTTPDAMRAAIEQGSFIEHAHVHTNYYGTSYDAVTKIQEQGKICVLDIDVQGVRNIKQRMAHPSSSSPLRCLYLFIAPPTMADLEKRLRGRATETDEKIRVRLENAVGELEYGREKGNFDAVIVNDTVEESYRKIVQFLELHYGLRNLDQTLN
jgi:guanylate kinase